MDSNKIPRAEQSIAKLVDNVHGIVLENRQQRPMIGIVLVPPPAIQVKLNDIIINQDDVYISEYLLVGYERTAKGVITSETQPRAGGSGLALFESHTHEIDNPYADNIIYTDTLKPGDLVSVIPLQAEGDGDDQLYFISDKVVKL